MDFSLIDDDYFFFCSLARIDSFEIVFYGFMAFFDW